MSRVDAEQSCSRYRWLRGDLAVAPPLLTDLLHWTPGYLIPAVAFQASAARWRAFRYPTALPAKTGFRLYVFNAKTFKQILLIRYIYAISGYVADTLIVNLCLNACSLDCARDEYCVENDSKNMGRLSH